MFSRSIWWAFGLSFILTITMVLSACSPETVSPATAPAVQATSLPTATTASTPMPATQAPNVPTQTPLAPFTVTPVATPQLPTPAIIPITAVRAQVIVLSNSTPHVTVIDAETNQVVRTADIPQFTSWGWNDDNNFYDGKNLWLGMRNPDTNAVEVVLLDLDSLQIVRRIPLGQDKTTLYIGKASRDGKLFVSKHASGQMVVLDLKTFAVLKTIDLPVNGGEACDIDVLVGPDGKERAFVPTFHGNSVLSIDTQTYELSQSFKVVGDTQPFMLTIAPDGKRVWVQENAGNDNIVLDAATLQEVARVPTAKAPTTNTFTPDGKLAFTGHREDTVVTANDTQSFKELWRSPVGTNPEKLGVHPAGTFVYAILTKEAAVAVLEAATGKVVKRIPLGTNPSGIFVRSLK